MATKVTFEAPFKFPFQYVWVIVNGNREEKYLAIITSIVMEKSHIKFQTDELGEVVIPLFSY